MNDITNIPGVPTTAESLAEVEATNKQLLLRLANLGVQLDGATIVAIRLDAALDMLLDKAERDQFELDFNVKFGEVLQQFARGVVTPSGLVIPQ